MVRSVSLFICACWFLAITGVDGAERAISYNRDVRPILSDNCFFCHGPDEKHREADLRLDVREEALAERDGVRAIVPGDPEKSELIYRLAPSDPEELMPPTKSHKVLSEREIDVLKAWVKQGAEYEAFWAYTLRAKIPVPAAEKGWPAKNSIDRFVQSGLKAQGLKPAPETDRVTWLRRVSFDLTGLPPEPSAVTEFLDDSSPKAYEKVVDRLLASPAYGERMAIMWLDLVRYADSVGYHGDQSIIQHPYRDYVIAAFNENMPYDRFTREQLAGDLLPGATVQQRVASAYNRLNMTTEEGGAQPKEYLAKYASDRVRNVSAVWMGATVGCAECHDHKYDPYTMKDFYSFAAFFADIQEKGKYGSNRHPTLRVPTAEQEAAIAEKRALISEKKKLTARTNPDVAARFASWIAERKSALQKPDDQKADGEASDILWVDDKPLRRTKGLGGWPLVKKVDASGKHKNPVVTQIVPAEKFYEAEKYHQDFFQLNPNHGYNRAIIAPKLKKLKLLDKPVVDK